MITGRVSEIVVQWFRDAVDKHKQGDDVAWEVFPALHPQAGFVMQFTLVIPSPLIGQQLAVGVLIDAPLALSAEGVDNLVAQMLEEARKQRSNALSVSDEQPPLIVP